MIVIGLTGSIATGKTTISNWLKDMGIPVFDADEAVHRLFEEDLEVISQIKELWPDCVKHLKVDRPCLRKQVLENKKSLPILEKITHPRVRDLEIEFITRHKKKGAPAVVLDVPLLYESSQNELCDCVLLVSSSVEVQKQRVQERGLSEELLDYLRSMQLPIAEKARRADYILNTDGKLVQTREKLLERLHEIEKRYQMTLVKN